MSTVFYDHDLPTKRDPSRGGLRKKVAHLKWREASLIPQEVKAGASLIGAVLGNEWVVGFFHISDDSVWNKLVEAAPRERALVRVSTQGFFPDVLESGDPLALRLLPRIDKVTAEQLSGISIALHDVSIRDEIRKGYVPSGLRGLFVFARPNFAAALWLYGVAWLAHRLAKEKHEKIAKTSRDLLRADILLAKVGWGGNWLEIEQAMCPTIVSVFSGAMLNGRSLADHLSTELGFKSHPEWVSVISEVVATGKDLEIKDMTIILEELTKELRIATCF